MTTRPKEWLFTAQSDFYSVTERVFDEKRLNHLARFVKKAHDHHFTCANEKPSYIHDRVNYYAWKKKKRNTPLTVTITPYNHANNQ